MRTEMLKGAFTQEGFDLLWDSFPTASTHWDIYSGDVKKRGTIAQVVHHRPDALPPGVHFHHIPIYVHDGPGDETYMIAG